MQRKSPYFQVEFMKSARFFRPPSFQHGEMMMMMMMMMRKNDDDDNDE